ncbi:hypothetical protein VR45_06275 [Streptomyces sp. NRRL S-495]|nr:hypothetical protein VR45_06275 [Streptomyces sp. NRRL S-495]
MARVWRTVAASAFFWLAMSVRASSSSAPKREEKVSPTPSLNWAQPLGSSGMLRLASAMASETALRVMAASLA